jgi:AcrR family transcriptional regulator
MKRKTMVKRTDKKTPPQPENVPPALIWQRMEERRKDRKLNYLSMTYAAMELADEGGVEGLSMRSLAERLGAGTMTLYRYVADRDDLLDLILDHAFSEIKIPVRATKDWRKDVTSVAVATRATMLRHPWLASLLIRRPTLGPNYLRWFEFVLSSTASAGKDLDTQLDMVGVIWAFIFGSVTYEVGEIENNRRHQLTEEKKRTIAEPYLSSVLATGQFPQLARVLARPRQANSAKAFRFGMKSVLDGLLKNV